jgi:N-carbamoylputrescine amidase
MSATSPFRVAILQDGVESTTAATLAATITRVRAAAKQGAQIICLKELFNAPYFCKTLDARPYGVDRAIARCGDSTGRRADSRRDARGARGLRARRGARPRALA